MTPKQLKKLDEALGAYLEEMVAGMGRPERQRAMEAHVTGLLLDKVDFSRASIEFTSVRASKRGPRRAKPDG